MAKIRVLDDLVANQIAAGEVVERPASAVKELVENAVDAGATQIAVKITGGGLQSIDVQDNGSGIEPDDLELAFVRHATSKLRVLDDLLHTHQLGFRGEALPSIAAVSRMVVRTRTKDAEGGSQVRYEGGSLAGREPTGCPVGTRMIISDLFYNTPARLKFVRSLQTEAAHVVDVVGRAAAARPDIAFSIQSEGKVQLQTSGDGLLTTVFAAVHGMSATKSAVAVLLEHPDYEIRGLISLPEFARTTRNAMWFAINDRPVRSLALANAVLDGYYTALPKGRYPLAFLSLTMDPSLVDVNVHPSKLEVRFSEERDVRELLKDAVSAALQAGFAPPAATLSESRATQPAPDAYRTDLGNADRVRETAADQTVSGETLPKIARPFDRSAKLPDRKESTVQIALSLQQPLSAGPVGERPAHVDMASSDATSAPVSETSVADESPFRSGDLRAVAQVLQMYIVAEDGEAVYLIDQHAAHERVLYESFRRAFRERGTHSLPLLVPLTIDVRPFEVPTLAACAEATARFGLIYELFGEHSFVVREIPHIWEGLDLDRLIRDVFTDLVEGNDLDDMLQMENRLIMKACKAAVKANQTLSLTEMNALLAAVATLERPFTCPHGRPTAIRLTRRQLEREFKRSL